MSCYRRKPPPCPRGRSLAASRLVRRRWDVHPGHFGCGPEAHDDQLRHECRLPFRRRRAQLEHDSPIPTSERYPLPTCFHPSNPDIIYALSGGHLRVSRDRGKTFSPLGNLKESLYGEIAINPDDPQLMLAGASNERCSLSHDGGQTWTECRGPAGRLLGFHFDRTRKGRVIFAGTQHGIWRSDDGGETWGERTNGLPWLEIQGFAAGSNPQTGVVVLYCTVSSRVENGTFAGGIYRSRDRGEHWERAMGTVRPGNHQGG